MIISDRHRFVFIEIPLTGSWSIHNELCEYYDGREILHKHATYPEFARTATPEQRQYFIFATVRNPLDELVSRYVKLKSDHKGAFSNPEAVSALQADLSDQKKYAFIRETDASFADFLRRYYRRPFGNLIDLSEKRLDYVIRFERLQDGFSDVLMRLEIPQVRPLPMSNQTQGKRAWESYYTPDLIEQARRVCGPFMRKWGYQFPETWGDYRPSLAGQAEYWLVSRARNLYMGHFRYSNHPYARAVRRLRASLIR